MLNALLWSLTCSAQRNRHIPWSFDGQPHVRRQPVSAAPYERRPVQHYATSTGAPATNVASTGVATCLLYRQHIFLPKSADPDNMVGEPGVYKHAER